MITQGFYLPFLGSPRKPARLAGWVLLWGMLLSPLVAQIQGVDFASTTLTRDSALGQKQVVAAFPFEVAGKKPVRILNIRSSCGCTTAELAKDVYRPGESGQIEARFVLGNRQGFQRNVIQVITDRGTQKLYFEVNIPALWELSSRVFVWNSEADEKGVSAELNFHPDLKHRILDFDIEKGLIKAQWEALTPGQAYAFSFTRTEASLPENQVVVGKIRVLDAREESYTIPVYFKF